MLDLILAVSLGTLAGFIQPGTITTASLLIFPLSLIPTFAVPLSFILHFAGLGQFWHLARKQAALPSRCRVGCGCGHGRFLPCVVPTSQSGRGVMILATSWLPERVTSLLCPRSMIKLSALHVIEPRDAPGTDQKPSIVPEGSHQQT